MATERKQFGCRCSVELYNRLTALYGTEGINTQSTLEDLVTSAEMVRSGAVSASPDNTAEIDALNKQIEELKAQLESSKTASDKQNSDVLKLQEELTNKSRLIESITAELNCTPDEVIDQIQQTQRRALAALSQPENSILLEDLTPLEKALLETTARYSGCLSVKEMLVNRFFMVYLNRGNGDYQIRRMKSEKLKLYKQKFQQL